MEALLEDPMKLEAWANAHQPDEKLIYKDGYWDQIIFVRDTLAGLLAATYEEYEALQANGITVISSHTSKSVCLPVFNIRLADGTAFTLRYNFHNWKVSVDSSRNVDADFMGLFDPVLQIHSVYCEGFPKELVYGPYAESKRQFTVELSAGNNHVFMFFWIFAYHVLGNRNKGGYEQ